MSDLVKTDKDMDLIEALEDRFSLHDVDMIYNLLSKFSIIDTKQGEITFNDFIKKERTKMKDKQLCCWGCGKDNIQWQVWADEFDKVYDGGGDDEIWCVDCEGFNKSILKEDYQKEGGLK